MKVSILKLLEKVFTKVSRLYWKITYSFIKSKYDISDQFLFNGRFIRFYGDGNIHAGPDSYVGEFSSFQAQKGCSIIIGQGCKISHNVRVYTQTAVADYDFSLGNIPNKSGDVIFSDFCWVGANVFIGPGVTIGANSVVGANSVITKDIPAFEIWGGVPAKLIRDKKIIRE
jgi:maltose O-acetyltransferase